MAEADGEGVGEEIGEDVGNRPLVAPNEYERLSGGLEVETPPQEGIHVLIHSCSFVGVGCIERR